MLIRHPNSARGNDLYETPEVATLALLAVEPLPPTVLEPACGRGEELERAGDDRAKAVTALTHRLLADETLRQALVEPIIRNIAAGSIATVVHHRRGAE